MRTVFKPNLSQVNKGLSWLNIVVAIYIFMAPLLPALQLFLKQRVGDTAPPYSGKLAAEAQKPTTKKPKGNRLVIPSILIDEKINEGPTESTLRQGVWRWPGGSNPVSGGNMVLAGHVFAYRSPAVFYHLDKIKVGERLAVYWEGSEYLYRVKEKRVVAAHQGEALLQTEEPTLTVYTCTPVWNPVNRLVLISTLEEVTQL